MYSARARARAISHAAHSRAYEFRVVKINKITCRSNSAYHSLRMRRAQIYDTDVNKQKKKKERRVTMSLDIRQVYIECVFRFEIVHRHPQSGAR